MRTQSIVIPTILSLFSVCADAAPAIKETTAPVAHYDYNANDSLFYVSSRYRDGLTTLFVIAYSTSLHKLIISSPVIGDDKPAGTNVSYKLRTNDDDDDEDENEDTKILSCSELKSWKEDTYNSFFNVISSVDTKFLTVKMGETAASFNLAVIGTYELGKALCDFNRSKRMKDFMDALKGWKENKRIPNPDFQSSPRLP